MIKPEENGSNKGSPEWFHLEFKASLNKPTEHSFSQRAGTIATIKIIKPPSAQEFGFNKFP